MKALILLILFQALSLLTCIDQDRLVFLYTHFRHGARAPQHINEKGYDILHEFWNNPGELTGVGQRMHYLLGLRNRLRYIKNRKFLNEKFDPHEILIYSSWFNRTMISCSSQLQGFYPQLSEIGNKLNDEQINMAIPRVNISDIDYKELKDEALPYYMTLAPVRMMNTNERSYKVYDIDECKKVKADVMKTNRETNPNIANFTKDFNDKYKDILNQFYGQNKEYDILDAEDFCDAFASCYADIRNFTDLKKTGIDIDKTNDYCYNTYYQIHYLYHIHGDKEKKLAHIASSRIMEKMLYYLKRRMDADITEEEEDSNYKDYSRPKMFMVSGHDSTVSSDLMFLSYSLGLNRTEIYKFPRYSSQLAIELKTTKEANKKSKYSDYYVTGFLDDKQIFNLTANDFIEKVEAEIWSEEKVNQICGFDSKNNTDSDIIPDKKDNAKKAYKILMIVFICLSAILLATAIFLGIKLKKI